MLIRGWCFSQDSNYFENSLTRIVQPRRIRSDLIGSIRQNVNLKRNSRWAKVVRGDFYGGAGSCANMSQLWRGRSSSPFLLFSSVVTIHT